MHFGRPDGGPARDQSTRRLFNISPEICARFRMFDVAIYCAVLAASGGLSAGSDGALELRPECAKAFNCSHVVGSARFRGGRKEVAARLRGARARTEAEVTAARADRPNALQGLGACPGCPGLRPRAPPLPTIMPRPTYDRAGIRFMTLTVSTTRYASYDRRHCPRARFADVVTMTSDLYRDCQTNFKALAALYDRAIAAIAGY